MNDVWKPIWEPIPGSAQELALTAPCHHILFWGTRGSGKSITQLMRFLVPVGRGYGTHWKGVIFDIRYQGLSDMIDLSKQYFGQIPGCRFYSSPSELKWTWKTGEQLSFRYLEKEEDYIAKMHGQTYPYVAWNELTKLPSPDLYFLTLSLNRSGFIPEKHTPRNRKGYLTPDGKPLPPIPLTVFSTTNPSGPGHNWAKRQFIERAPVGQIVEIDIPVKDPISQKETRFRQTQVSLFSHFQENIYLSSNYAASLIQATEKNPNRRKAWLEGSWDIVAGGIVDDLWDSSIHVVNKFTIPENWYVNRSFDWGSSAPFAVLWFAEANGEEVPGLDWAPPPKTLFVIAEWYGADSEGNGLRLSASEIAKGIRKRERSFPFSVLPGPADNQIRDVREKDVATIAGKMEAEGISWTRSDKSPGSRKIGLEMIREGLLASRKKEGPGLYFFVDCGETIRTITTLPRSQKNPDDAEGPEDHLYDALRYRLLASSSLLCKPIPVQFPI